MQGTKCQWFSNFKLKYEYRLHYLPYSQLLPYWINGFKSPQQIWTSHVVHPHQSRPFTIWSRVQYKIKPTRWSITTTGSSKLDHRRWNRRNLAEQRDWLLMNRNGNVLAMPYCNWTSIPTEKLTPFILYCHHSPESWHCLLKRSSNDENSYCVCWIVFIIVLRTIFNNNKPKR